MAKKRADTDEFESTVRIFMGAAAGFGIVLSSCLIRLRTEWSWLASFAVGATVTFVAFACVALVLRLQGKAIDGFFGRGREPDPGDGEWESLRDGAKLAEREKDWAELVFHLKAQLTHPKGVGSPVTAYRIAQIYDEKLARPVDALYWFRKTESLIRESNPENPETHPLWEPVRAALAEVTRIRDAHGEYLGGELESARSEIERGEFEDAVGRLKELVRRFPGDAELQFLLGVAEARLGRNSLAAERYREAVRLDADHLRAWFNLGAANFNLDRLPEAREAWNAYLEHARDREGEEEYTAQATEMLRRVEDELRPEIDGPFSP
ncbi:MAG: tetratricopeptide repeat protein [Deltaproteobacteria bacterium]|nr:tetratricopeptide repeat protein [Deltaproteobacteria bacterium]